LQYQIKRCLAPCVPGYVTDEAYAAQVKLVTLFLKGKNQQVITELVTQMETAATTQAYEQAARIRDQIKALTTVVEQQEVSRLDGDMDVIGLAYEHGLACVYMMFIRQGKILGHRHYYPKIPPHTEMLDVMRGFVVQFYLHEQRQNLPKEVLLATEFADLAVLQETMRQKLEHPLVFKTQVRGDRANFIRLAKTNATHALQAKLDQNNTVVFRLQALEAALEWTQPIKRLECFDISHTQGEATMASCVVFDETGPVNRDYRRYRIQGIQGGDDYAAMRQALTKRYQDTSQLPDLLFIDGGIGQLKVAEAVLAEAIPEVEKRPFIIGVAKGEGRKAGLEKLIFAGSHETVRLAADDPGLHLVQWIRDESHRFAITGHRQARQKKRNTSTLESIPGVGPKRRQKLLQYLGGIQEVHQASVTQLKQVPGISDELAQIIFDALQR
ncbi:MAG: excinuclease ABC subunit UvrC, partial [Shewanellaceae bacterium]|nr:excinuclease ABC subunit UvrC [Shewanellaceae bacterium]